MTRVGSPKNFAPLVRDIDPSRKGPGPDASPGVITETEKPAARAALDARIADLAPKVRHAAGLTPHLERMQALRRRLDEPGDVDVRSDTYRRAQEAGLPAADIDRAGHEDYRLTPDELDGAIGRAGARAAELDARARETRARGGDATQVEGEVRAAVHDLVRLRQHKVLAHLERLALPPGSHVDVTSMEGLLSLRETLDQEIGRIRARQDPAVVRQLAREPAAVAQRLRELGAARSAVSMTMGGAHAQAQALYDATWGRLGTHEGRAQVALAQMHLQGSKDGAEEELSRLMRMNGVPVPSDGRPHAAIRHTIDANMSFVDREVAARMFATGRDDMSTSNTRYILHALIKPIDAAFDWAVDNPGGAAAIVGAGAVAAATLPLSVLVGAGVGVGLAEVGTGAYGLARATDRASEVEALYRMGSGISGLGLAALPGLRLPARTGVRTGPAPAPRVNDGPVDPRSLPHRVFRHVMGALGKQQDLMNVTVLETNPGVVYRVAYYAPGRTEYAWTNYDKATSMLRNTPGARLYRGVPRSEAESMAMQAPRHRGTPAVITENYRWELVR